MMPSQLTAGCKLFFVVFFMFSIKNPKQELVIYASTGIGGNLLTLFG